LDILFVVYCAVIVICALIGISHRIIYIRSKGLVPDIADFIESATNGAIYGILIAGAGAIFYSVANYVLR